ncbi:hypothetical protein CPB85DRAFT_1469039 [Mucidula mucida]|nr:hypothetical protein CPB85DRAFT_1469039 [Mucidula mucida]
MTPPNATPPASEHREFNRLDLERVASSFAKIAKVCHNTARATFYSIFILEILFILGLSLSPVAPADSCEIHITWPFLVSRVILVGGASLRVHCYQIMEQFFTFELCIRKDHRLITSGPYTGAILAAFGSVGCALLPGSWLECVIPGGMTRLRWLGVMSFWAAVIRSALIPRMRKEDDMLREAFGEEWENWRKLVPCRLIPGVY